MGTDRTDGASAEGRCVVCGAAASSFALCFCCDTLVRQLQMALVPLVPIADYRAGDALHRHLRGYKDAPVVEERAAHGARLASLLETWIGARDVAHSRIRAWDLVAVVPSSSRPAGFPLERVVLAVPAFGRRYRRLLVRGPDPTGHLQGNRRGFSLHPETDRRWLRDLRVLLVEDSAVTGARAQSAAAALRLAGARVPGILAIGRLERSRPRAGRGSRLVGSTSP